MYNPIKLKIDNNKRSNRMENNNKSGYSKRKTVVFLKKVNKKK